jgi:DNA-binding MarR family transcriptional regulator
MSNEIPGRPDGEPARSGGEPGRPDGEPARSDGEPARSGGEPGRADGEPGPPGFELPLLLFAGFRSIIDEVHADLARRGHPDLRPAHGFALQAIGLSGATATETGRRLGISKQAAGKTIDRLEELGYVQRFGDDADRRRKLARLTPRGFAVLALSAMIFNDIRARWAVTLGVGRLSDLEDGLRTMAPDETFRLDVPGWFGA